MVSQIQRLADGLTSEELDADRTLETMADSRCRNVLYYLVREGDSVELDELARFASDADHERAVIRLHHVTLPKLDDVGLLEYDPEAHTVELAHPVSQMRDFLLRFRLPGYSRS